MSYRTCSIPACDKRHEARGWCATHYQRWRAHGDTGITLQVRGDDEARFWSKVSKTPDGCWLWTDPVYLGYGRFKAAGATRPAHVWAYEHFVGPIPAGMQVDHVKANGCTNRHCVNYEDHLEPVTPRENVLRRGSTKMSDADVLRAWGMRQDGQPIASIALAFDIDVRQLYARFRRLRATPQPTPGS